MPGKGGGAIHNISTVDKLVVLRWSLPKHKLPCTQMIEERGDLVISESGAREVSIYSTSLFYRIYF